jgi:hypothetical protein
MRSDQHPQQLTPADRLQHLLDHPGLRPVYRRLARTALRTGNAAAIAAEIVELEREIARAESSAALLRTTYPSFSALLA